MSHFTRVKTKIISDAIFCQALDALGIRYQHTPGMLTVVRIPGGSSFTAMGQTAEIARYGDIFLEQDHDGGYSLRYSGDLGQRNQAAIRLILQQYALTVLQLSIAERGMEIVEMERLPDGSIRARMVGPASFSGMKQPGLDAQIGTDGIVRAELSGFVGQACAPVMQQLQQALGGEVLSEEPTSDWWDGDSGAALWRNDFAG